MKTQFSLAGLLALGFALVALPASAGFIEGDLTFSGDFVPTGGTTLGTATGIDFVDNDFDIDAATMDFAVAGIARSDTGSISDFSFAGFAGPMDLWSIGGFTFRLEAVRVVFQNNWFLLLTGHGMVSGNGYLDTYGSWSLSANRGGNLFNFSSGTAVPEPATGLLVGLGLAGLLARRRRT